MRNIIEVAGLTKRFGEITAVDHIDFEVRKGEIFGFLGPDGAGKTTTIRILTGIIKPDSGEAIILGYDILRNPLKAKQFIGVVPETANAYIDLTAWQNLMLTAELYGIPKRERHARAKRLLKDLGLYKRRNSLVRGFSKGMKQKLILCMALISNPQILFLDEPTTGLDVESARFLRSYVRQLSKQGTTVFLSTHNMEEANKLCDRIAIINHGKIAAIDTPENLKMKSKGLKSIEISFNKPVDVEAIRKVTDASRVEKLGDKIKLHTNKIDKTIRVLVNYARENNLKIVSLNTLTPSLEDVFIELIKKKHVGAD